jgi:hypothetical protein
VVRTTSMWLRIVLAVQLCLAVLLFSARADAYAWMIRHDYASCTACHADPSGGSLLTPYGRAQGQVLLVTQYKKSAEDQDPGTVGDFMFGAFTMPEALLMQADVRAAAVSTSGNTNFVMMQADYISQVTVGRFRANSSVGYLNKGGNAAWVLGRTETHHLLSRHHWLGIDIGEDKQALLRIGRMNLPYGLRSIEHGMWVRRQRTPNATDINTGQQHGIALAYNVDKIRAEAMLIGGNFQLSPDDYRSRGYAGYFEYAPDPKLAVGLSSMITHASRDLELSAATFRQAHGPFARYTPHKKFVLSGEVDYLIESQKSKRIQTGLTGMVQMDFEPIQGVHAIAAGEFRNARLASQGTDFGAWGGVAWFFLPHTDLRVDAIWRSDSASSTSTVTLLGQLHFFL